MEPYHQVRDILGFLIGLIERGSVQQKLSPDRGSLFVPLKVLLHEKMPNSLYTTVGMNKDRLFEVPTSHMGGI